MARTTMQPSGTAAVRRKPAGSFLAGLKSLVSLRPGSDRIILASMLVLLLFGTIMIISIQLGTGAESVANALDSNELSRFESLRNSMVTASILSAAGKQLLFIALSYVTICLTSRLFTFSRWKMWDFNVCIALLALLAATIAFGREISGSRAWLTLGSFWLQPSEFAKPVLILVYAYCMYRLHRQRRHQKESVLKIFGPAFAMTGAVAFFLVWQKDFGTLTILMSIALVCFMIPGLDALRRAQRWVLLALIVGFVLAATLLVFSDTFSSLFARIPFLSHIAIRIENMKNPYRDIYGNGYQPANSLYGIGDAGLFGRGLGNSIRKYGYLTQSESDYILSVIIEETGIIGLGIITVCTALIIWRLFHWALLARSDADRIVLAGSGAYILLHFIINAGGVGGLIPMTGVPLLFISSGGSSLLAVSLTLGICESRIAHIVRERKRERTDLRKL